MSLFLKPCSPCSFIPVVQKNFVQTVRAVEAVLGIISDVENDSSLDINSITNLVQSTGNLTEALLQAGTTTNGTVIEALVAAAPMLVYVAEELGISDLLTAISAYDHTPLTTTFMDAGWQSDQGANPADAADGPQAYDNHLYYS